MSAVPKVICKSPVLHRLKSDAHNIVEIASGSYYVALTSKSGVRSTIDFGLDYNFNEINSIFSATLLYFSTIFTNVIKISAFGFDVTLGSMRIMMRFPNLTSFYSEFSKSGRQTDLVFTMELLTTHPALKSLEFEDVSLDRTVIQQYFPTKTENPRSTQFTR